MSMFGPDIPKLELNGRVLTLVDASSAASSSVDIGPDISGAVAQWASAPASQSVNMNSKSLTNAGSVLAQSVTANTINAGVNATLDSDTNGGRLLVPAGKTISLTSGMTNALHINSAGNVGIRMINTGATNVEVAGSLSATGQIRGVGASISGEMFTQAVTPNFNNTYDSGRPTSRWATVNTVNLSATGTVIANSTIISYDVTNGGKVAVPASKSLTLTTGTINAVQISGSGVVSINNDTAVAGKVLSVLPGATDRQFIFGYDNATDKGVIECVHQGIAVKPIRLQGSGVETAGNIECGGSVSAVGARFNGNVSVGTNSAPAYTLDVGGFVAGTSDNTIRVTNKSWARGLQLQSSLPGASGVADYFISRGGQDAFKNQLVLHAENINGAGINFCSSGAISRMFIDTYTGAVNVPGAFTAGSINSSGSITARSFYTYTALTGTVSQNGYGALFVPTETGAYLFSAYLTSAAGTANIMGMMFAVNGTIVRISTQAATLMVATGTNETSLLIQNLSATASPIRISVQRFGL